MQQAGLPVVSALEVGGGIALGARGGRPKVNDLHSEWLSLGVDQHDVLWLEVSVDQTQFLQLCQARQHLTKTKDKLTKFVIEYPLRYVRTMPFFLSSLFLTSLSTLQEIQ